MDTDLARRLCSLNTAFYREHAASFSQTRSSSWVGWDRVADTFAENPGRPLCVLDVACGNLRFETYLQQRFPERSFDFHAVDNCVPLVGSVEVGFPFRFEKRDVVGELIDVAEGKPVTVRHPATAEERPIFGSDQFDVAVAFGFLHHLPGKAARLLFLRSLVEAVKPGGVCAVSFWSFMKDPRLAAKAVEATAHGVSALGLAGLEENDFLLGWQQAEGAYRYCHHFDKAEIAELAAGVGDLAKVGLTFEADGKSGNLNTYVVLRRS